MSTEDARAEASEAPTGRLLVRPPPEVPDPDGSGGMVANAVPLLGSLGSILVVSTMTGPARGRGLLAAGMFAFATVGFLVVQMTRHRRQRTRQVTSVRRGYLRDLAHVRRVARDAASRQRRAALWHHPEPGALPGLAAEGSRLWERQPADPRWLLVRYGHCPQPASLELATPEGQGATDRTDPVAGSALRRLLQVQPRPADLPAAIDLRAFGRIELCGDEAARRSLARAIVCSAIVGHGPDHLRLGVVTDARGDDWEWTKWLPHLRSRRRSDRLGPRRMVAATTTELASLLPAEVVDRPSFSRDQPTPLPHVLVVLDDARPGAEDALVPRNGLLGVTVLDLGASDEEPPRPGRLRLKLSAPDKDGTAVLALRPGEQTVEAVADRCSTAVAEAVGRRLASSAAGRSPGSRTARSTGLPELLGLDDVRRFDPTRSWGARPERDHLRVPIGIDDSGAPVVVDLKESAQRGMGPHGVLVGATGSGKSELLRTLVLALALTHSPERLAMLLVDFKGGATFAGLAPLPHVAGMITNLADDLALVDRMREALAGELVRRQQMLRAAGDLASAREYELARAAGRPLAPLPSLLVVVDEFSELLTSRPEILDLVVTIGRLGRSLGLHLLVASQRLDEGRLRGLESHLSYRIALRTFSTHESRAILGVPDAGELPPVPGLGLLRTDQSTLVRFSTSCVSAAMSTDRVAHCQRRCAEVLPFVAARVPADEDDESGAGPAAGPATPGAGDPLGLSLLDVAVATMSRHGPTARRIWSPPLDRSDSLGRLMPDLAVDQRLGLVSGAWRALGRLRVPVGVVDRPREQRCDPLTLDLAGAGGHVAVVGGPLSGKTTMLRTVVAALALVSPPTEVQFFLLDLAGGGLAALTGLPHVAGAVSREEPDLVGRTVAQVTDLLDRREGFFRARGLDSAEAYRRHCAAGHEGDGYGDVFVVVDGWGGLRTDHGDLEHHLERLAGRGLALGVHLVVASSRWADIRAGTRELLGSRLELRLGEPADSEVDRRAAAAVPAGRPGRGLVAAGLLPACPVGLQPSDSAPETRAAFAPGPAGLHFLAAWPRLDDRNDAGTARDGLDGLVRRCRQAWRGPDGPKLRRLPERVDLDRVRPAPAGPDDHRLLLGIDERDHAPVWWDPASEPHLLVLGEGRSGRTTLLRTWLRELMRTRTAAQAQVLLVDPRRTLLGEVPEAYSLGHLSGAVQTGTTAAELAAYLRRRMPGAEVTPDQLRRRRWWTGAEAHVVVDDYELVSGCPLAELVPLLPLATDVGLHVVVARRAGGVARGYDPMLQGLRDLGTPGLLLAGSPEEGPVLGGVRLAPAPPGRARLVDRDRRVRVLQVGWTDPAPGSGPAVSPDPEPHADRPGPRALLWAREPP